MKLYIYQTKNRCFCKKKMVLNNFVLNNLV